MYIFVVIGLVIWIITVIPVYRLLRSWIVRDSVSWARRILFALVCGTLVAPGILGLGHPPPVPFPGAVLLFPLYFIIGGHGEDGYFFAFANLFSWLGVTGCFMLMELEGL